MRHKIAHRRRGALAVESAVVLPVLLFLILALIVGGMGVFRYQQVACQAREAARWASVRGEQWHVATRNACPTESDIVQNAVLPYAEGMEPSKLTVTIEWIDSQTGTATAWDKASKNPWSMTPANDSVTNRVRVSISYQWQPGVLLPGSLTLVSVSEVPMSF